MNTSINGTEGMNEGKPDRGIIDLSYNALYPVSARERLWTDTWLGFLQAVPDIEQTLDKKLFC